MDKSYLTLCTLTKENYAFSLNIERKVREGGLFLRILGVPSPFGLLKNTYILSKSITVSPFLNLIFLDPSFFFISFSLLKEHSFNKDFFSFQNSKQLKYDVYDYNNVY